jgi:hypothetical protein
LAISLAVLTGGTALAVGVVLVVMVVQTFRGWLPEAARDVVQRGYAFGLILALVGAAAVGLVAYLRGSGLAGRVTDLGLAVNKLGRGGAAVRVRVAGNDEVTSLGQAIQYLANDLAALFEEQEKAGTTNVAFDPLVRALRDRLLPKNGLAAPAGFEVDGALSKGSRGGLDYFDSVVKDSQAVLLLVSAEGAGPLAVLACKMARDEIVRALEAGATARKALSHANRVMHRQLPSSVCAKATLLELGEQEVKLYQAGARAPLLVCTAGDVREVAADGLGLGLDEGPVFEKQLRSEKVPVAQGIRLVVTNDAGYRHEGLRELVRTHSPKHTTPFMNLVLGGLEEDSGAEGLRDDVVLLTAKRW